MIPVAPFITGITFTFTFHMHCIYIVRSLCFKIFSASFLIIFLSPGIATSINMHVLFSLSRITMSGLLLGIVLSVCTCLFQSSHRASLICYYWVWYMFVPVFFVQLHPYFLAYVEVYLRAHFIMPFYILFFCQYWACLLLLLFKHYKPLWKSIKITWKMGRSVPSWTSRSGLPILYRPSAERC